MNKKSKYFEDAINYSNENFMNYDGDWESADDWEGADDLEGIQEDLGADGDYDDDEYYEEAQGRRPANSQSQPYIVKIENTTTAAVSNVIILDAAVRQTNFTVAGVSITYGLSGITYAQFLSSIASGQTFQVGQLRLIGSSTTSTNAETVVLTTTTVTTKSINGNQIIRPFVPQKDSFQQINTQTDIFYQFMCDALTQIKFDSIPGSTTLTVYIYPAAKVNPFQQVKGRRGVSEYRNPRTNFSLGMRR